MLLLIARFNCIIIFFLLMIVICKDRLSLHKIKQNIFLLNYDISPSNQNKFSKVIFSKFSSCCSYIKKKKFKEEKLQLTNLRFLKPLQSNMHIFVLQIELTMIHCLCSLSAKWNYLRIQYHRPL